MISKEKFEYSKKILYSYLVKKRRNIPIHKLSYLSSGTFADAFRYKDRVFKVTSSYEDFRMVIGEGLKSPHQTFFKEEEVKIKPVKLNKLLNKLAKKEAKKHIGKSLKITNYIIQEF